MATTPTIGGQPVVFLQAEGGDGRKPGVVQARVAPGRGAMLLGARARLPGGEEVEILAGPSLEEAVARLNAGGPEDFAGNLAFSLGGAILLPYANRITGHPIKGAREIETTVAGRPARLPMNWGGEAPGARQYAMHGLLLDRAADQVRVAPNRMEARFDLEDFGGRWPSRTTARVSWALERGVLQLVVQAENLGETALPMGIGWHPYFALPSGRRDQARLKLPAQARLAVNDYDEVLPTGEVLPVADTVYDFRGRSGAALDALYLDDCFVDLMPTAGFVSAEILDPAARYGLRVTATAPPVRAFQVYAPPNEAFVALEPQLHWADPYAPQWKGRDTGMALIPPGGSLSYRVAVSVMPTGRAGSGRKA